MRSWPSPSTGSASSSRSSDGRKPHATSARSRCSLTVVSARRPVLVLATMNRGKARELTALLGDVPFDLRALSDYAGAVAPEETETTYRGNALLKARAAARLTGAWTLGDDSGLE